VKKYLGLEEKEKKDTQNPKTPPPDKEKNQKKDSFINRFFNKGADI
jgi:hypothetical protein